MSAVHHARSMLFVPGHRPDRFDRALHSGADVVILDLEDSVGRGQKEAARTAAAQWLSRTPRPDVIVRVNAAGTDWHHEDVDMVAAAACSIMVPKAEDPEALQRIRRKLSPATSLVALVETARGVHELPALCNCGAVERVAFGSVDFALDIQADLTRSAAGLAAARSAVVLQSVLAALPAPVDGVTTAVRDADALAADLADARAFGFGGKLAIHPDQVAAVNQAWTPSDEEAAWAENVMTAVGTDGTLTAGVVVIDGQMIDEPLVARARRVLHSRTRTTNGAS